MTNQKIKILYIDDEPVNLLLFERMFEGFYDVITAESGSQGVLILEKSSDIQVVISDMKMPIMNGLEFITKVRPMYPDIHYYLLSGYELTPEIQNSLSDGLILKYFQKPFLTEEIDNVIKETLLEG